MKLFLPACLCTLAFLSVAPVLQAQILPGAVPWVTHTNSRLTSAFDANADGLTDVLDINRAQGSFTLGLRQANGTYTWSEPRSVGFADVESMAVGRFISPTDSSFMVSSREFNNVQPVPLDGSDLPQPLGGSPAPEPQALATVPVTSGPQGVAIGYAGTEGAPLKLGLVAQNFGLWQSYEMADNARHAGTVYLRSGMAPVIAVFGNAVTPNLAQLQIFRADETSVESVTQWSGLPPGSRLAVGFFEPDVSSQAANYPSTTLITWEPGAPHLRIARLTGHDVANNTSFEDLTLLPLPIVFDMQRPLSSVHVLYKPSGHRLLLTYADLAGGAAIYDFDGELVPEFIEGLSLNGLNLDAITPLQNGEFLAHGLRNGQPTYDLYTESSPGHYTASTTGTLPTRPNKAFYSNIVAFAGEPFVQPLASALKRSRVSDWTLAASPPGSPGGNASVTALTDNGATLGLAGPSGSNLAVPEDTTHFLVSQMSPLSSIAFLSAKTVPQSNLPVPQFQPPPGQYPPLAPSESLSIIIEVPGAGFDTTVWYSLNGSPWQYTSRFSPIELTGPATIRAYATSYVSGTGPIVTGVYHFSSFSPISAPPAADANMNGLSDDWENLTGITNPALDDDGDGVLNLAEHNAGYDPNDPSSHPPTITEPPALAVAKSPDQTYTLRWDSTDAAILLETSSNMQDWSLVTHGVRLEDDERVFDLPLQSFPRRFYRLRR